MSGVKASGEKWPWVALRMVPGVGVGHYHELLRRFEHPGAVLAASEADLREAGLPPAMARAVRSPTLEELSRRDVGKADATGVKIITWADPDYPRVLREIHDPPPYLYVRGCLEAGDDESIAVVGARAASSYGRDMARGLAGELAVAGWTVVSGLAYGVDAAAHRGALGAGGRTIAVLGCGADIDYPGQHADLAAAIRARGAVISEFFMGTPPRSGNFPIRNRIISGLARGTVVVEASERSGSLITARCALDQGREVFAVPGPVTAPRSRGANRLIRQGAKLVTAASDVLDELNVRPRVVPAGPAASAQAGELSGATVEGGARRLVDVLTEGAADVDSLVASTGLTPPEVLRILLDLELCGMVRQFPGATFVLREREGEPGAALGVVA